MPTHAEPVVLPPSEKILDTLRDERPRLIVTAEDFKRTKQFIDENDLARSWFEKLKGKADQLLDQPPREYEIPDGKRLLYVSRDVKDRIFTLATIYRLTGEKKYAERCWSELAKVCSYKDWNPYHFLDTAEMTLAVAIGYDWLHDVWTDEQKKTLRDSMIRLGLTPALQSYRNTHPELLNWWIHATHNWNQVCNGGIAVGALAIADTHPDLAREILAEALPRLPKAMVDFAPDGAWEEGPSYWRYAMEYNLYIIAGLQSALGSDFGLSEMAGFAKAGDFPIHLCGPSGDMFNFADAHGKRVRGFMFHWLGRRYDNPLYAAYGRAHHGGEALELLLLDRPVPSERLHQVAPDARFRKSEIATFRDRWNDPEAMFIALKSGENGVNHGQLDLGTFILDALGERWFIDLGPDDYNLPGYFDKNNGRWHFYRNRAEGHNTLVINPDKNTAQAPNAKTRIDRFTSEKTHGFAITDLSAAYPMADRIERGVRLDRDQSILIQDEIELKSPGHLWWFAHTTAAIEISEDHRTATLTLNKKQVRVRLLDPGAARFSVTEARPFPTSPTVKGQANNEGIRRLTIEMREVQTATIRVIVEPIRPGTDDEGRVMPELSELKAWK